jgi:raffinose/stachyose/melibiose transport system substrate-binding protein
MEETTVKLTRGRAAIAATVLVGAGMVLPGVAQAQDPVEIDWWHIQTNDPGLSLNQAVADEYMAAHPGVKINITVLENEAFKSKLALEMQGGNAPDIFQSWGGGVLAEQAAAGMARSIADDWAKCPDELNPGALSIYQVGGEQYGIPYNFGLVGFWYNKDLFAQAGITAPPTTWEEFLTDIQTLKDKGITPIALAGGDKWPAMFYWAYLALREGGQAALEQAISSGDWTADAFIQAGTQLKRLIDLQPFQEGFLAGGYNRDEASTMGNGKAAMELMGQWAPGVEQAESESGKGIGDALGWFPFPGVDGGAGKPTDVFGGADGFAVGKDAPAEAVDFLCYLVSTDVAKRFAATNTGILPATEAATSAVTDPTLATLLQKRAEATFAQLYLDQATTPALGQAINDAVQLLFAGQASPQDVAQQITDAAQNQ